MGNTNADGSPSTDNSGWFDNLFGSVAKLATLAPAVGAWKELIDPVRAAQTPTLGMGSSGPVNQVPPGTMVTKPGVVMSINPLVYLVGGLAVLLLVVLMGRK